MQLLVIVLLPFVGSLCAAFLPSNARNSEAWLAGAVTLACTVLVALQYPAVAAGKVLRITWEWVPALNLSLQLRMDGYAWVFAMLISGMGTLVVMYARYYMSPADPVPRFFSFLLAFMAAMLGVVLSGDLLQMIVFWELTSFTSFMLIAYWYHLEVARRGALMALAITAAGGLCLLAGVLMIGNIVGSYQLDEVLAAGGIIRAHPWYPTILVLVVLGAFTKSAQFPFHFWLPNAMSAPTPVSAYLHSATMVKAGVFLLARLWPVLSGTELWFTLVCGAGLITLLLGASAALFQRDIKGVLAYSTISHLGLITLLLGMNSPLALVAALFHMMNHATFKASLFMAAGVVDHETGTRDLRRLGGLARAMPITAALATVAAAAMAGVPLLNGFLSKEMFFAESIFAGQSASLRVLLPAAATLAGVFSVAYSVRLIHRTFFGPLSTELPRTPHEPIRWMLAPGALLVGLCLLVGIFPAHTIGPFLHLATLAILGDELPVYSLKVWHGFTLPLAMSVVALAGGALLYILMYRRQAGALAAAPLRRRFDGRRTFNLLMVTMIRAAARALQMSYSRRLQPQLLIIVAGILLLGSWIATRDSIAIGATQLTPPSPAFALLWIVGAACALGAAAQAKFHRLAALIMTGGAGVVVVLTFAWFSAPDLALTQLSVEVVTLVLLLLGLRWMPRRVAEAAPERETFSARLRRVRDLLLATSCGAGASALAWYIMIRPRSAGISPFFLENALPLGGGHNVVNVILVDFRGFDTMGEITVVGIVALTVYKLLRRFRPAPESMPMPRAQREDSSPATIRDLGETLPNGYMRVPAVLGRLLLPVAAVISVFFLLRGHNAPGGGFVGGLVMATAFVVQYMVSGTLWIESRIRIHPQYWISGGLLFAGFTGVAAWFAGRNFLTSLEWDLHLPLVGALHLSSTLIFDLGVYLLVVGGTTLILVAIAHQSLRSHQRHDEAVEDTATVAALAPDAATEGAA
ncbi:MAG: monovalent cation/H+ antiporter subunit A [Steroidobacteraceae bacterium]